MSTLVNGRWVSLGWESNYLGILIDSECFQNRFMVVYIYILYTPLKINIGPKNSPNWSPKTHLPSTTLFLASKCYIFSRVLLAHAPPNPIHPMLSPTKTSPLPPYHQPPEVTTLHLATVERLPTLAKQKHRQHTAYVRPGGLDSEVRLDPKKMDWDWGFFGGIPRIQRRSQYIFIIRWY